MKALAMINIVHVRYLRKYVKAGWLGKKSGRGFYVYE